MRVDSTRPGSRPPIWRELAVRLEHWRAGRLSLLSTADAFFLHVENPDAPQLVGGLVLLEHTGDDRPSLDQMRTLLRSELGELPRFRQRLAPVRWWRRARWTAVTDIDWVWHVSERAVRADTVKAGEAAALQLVAELAAEGMPRDRPLWRIVMVRGVGPGRSAMILLLHHCVADGIGTMVQALNLLRPRIVVGADARAGAGVGSLQRALGTAVGLGQLATDGRPAVRLPAGSAARRLAAAALDLATVRAVARAHGARVTDVLLCLVAEALTRVQPEFAARTRGRLRVAVPLMVRTPGEVAAANLTAAVMTDVPLGPMAAAERLAHIRRHSDRLRTPTRALASRFVLADLLQLLPELGRRWFARTVYGAAFFQAIVSNLPGPTEPLALAGVWIDAVVPVLPLAPGAPLAVGALSWDGVFGVGLAVDTAVLDADAVAAQLATVLAELEQAATVDAHPAGGFHSSATNMRARARGESSSSPKHSRS